MLFLSFFNTFFTYLTDCLLKYIKDNFIHKCMCHMYMDAAYLIIYKIVYRILLRSMKKPETFLNSVNRKIPICKCIDSKILIILLLQIISI